MKVKVKELQKMPIKILFGVTKYREDNNLNDEITDQLLEEIQKRGMTSNYSMYKDFMNGLLG